MVDQDPSDNVTTEYLLNPATGQTAQYTTANAANMAGSTLLLNGSDNTLLDRFLDPALGCTPFQAPDLGNNGLLSSSQALDELLVGQEPARIAALVPENDEMVLDATAVRRGQDQPVPGGVGQPPVSFQNNQTSSPAMYCQNMVNIQTPFLAANQTLLATGQSPVTGGGQQPVHLHGQPAEHVLRQPRCQNFGLTNPVTVTLDGNGAATAATFNTTQQTATKELTATPVATPSNFGGGPGPA